MNPLSIIPAGLQVWVRIAVLVALAFACAAVGWIVNGWRLGADLQALKAEHAQTVADAAAKTLTAQKKAQADHDALAAQLAAQSATYHEDLTRAEHANDTLRASVATGTRVLRIAATCPAAPDHVPEAAAGGRVDSGAGAVLDPAAGQAVLDLRAAITGTEHQLAACQAAVKCLTGQGACPAPSASSTPKE